MSAQVQDLADRELRLELTCSPFRWPARRLESPAQERAEIDGRRVGANCRSGEAGAAGSWGTTRRILSRTPRSMKRES